MNLFIVLGILFLGIGLGAVTTSIYVSSQILRLRKELDQMAGRVPLVRTVPSSADQEDASGPLAAAEEPSSYSADSGVVGTTANSRRT
jgi:hypothetical protein